MTFACSSRYKASSSDECTSARFSRGMRLAENAMKVIGLAGWSGAGKTTLLTRLIPHLREQGLRVSVIKHAHHSSTSTCPARIPGGIARRARRRCWSPPAIAGR